MPTDNKYTPFAALLKSWVKQNKKPAYTLAKELVVDYSWIYRLLNEDKVNPYLKNFWMLLKRSESLYLLRKARSNLLFLHDKLYNVNYGVLSECLKNKYMRHKAYIYMLHDYMDGLSDYKATGSLGGWSYNLPINKLDELAVILKEIYEK